MYNTCAWTWQPWLQVRYSISCRTSPCRQFRFHGHQLCFGICAPRRKLVEYFAWSANFSTACSMCVLMQRRLLLRLCIVYLLRCRASGFVAWFAVKCSSWSSMNKGTSGRTPCSSVGDPTKPSVVEANMMLERILS